jgi:hypothetical protein
MLRNRISRALAWAFWPVADVFAPPMRTLNVIEHGDADIDLMWQEALGAVSPDNRRPDLSTRYKNRLALTKLMSEQEWRAIERSALDSDLFSY